MRSDWVISIIVILILAGIAVWFFWDKLPLSNLNLNLPFQSQPEVENITTQEGSDELVKDQADTLNDISRDFINLYSDAVAKTSDSAANKAYDLLSERGKIVVDLDDNKITGLKRLMRNLEPPRQVSVQTSREQSAGFAETTLTLTYPDQTLTRYVYFVIEDNHWQIDSVQAVQQ